MKLSSDVDIESDFAPCDVKVWSVWKNIPNYFQFINKASLEIAIDTFSNWKVSRLKLWQLFQALVNFHRGFWDKLNLKWEYKIKCFFIALSSNPSQLELVNN